MPRVNDDRITIRVTETGMTMDVTVFRKRKDCIEVVLGEGIHSVKCELTPTVNSLGYAGSALGREIVYERTPEQVAQDIAVENHDYRDSRRR